MTIAHERERQIFELFNKKMKFSPIVSIQGPRQSGKSYFAKKLLPQKIKNSIYYTMDQKEIRSFAENNPRSFLTQNDKMVVTIDEVQKVPDLFDEMKAIVDDKRTPGQFVILGSTEFSHETQIRESLTGRLTRVRLYPFNLSETLKLKLSSNQAIPFISNKPRASRSELIRYLQNGGLPGIFNVKSTEEKNSLFADWISLTVERDIFQLKKHKLDSEIAYNVLKAIAILDEPSMANIANSIKVNSKRVTSYLNVLKTLFVIFEVKPFRESTGKPLYFLTDTGLLNHLGADFEKRLRTWFYLEMLSQLSYRGLSFQSLHYYRTAKGNRVDLIFEEGTTLKVVKIIPTERHDERNYKIFNSLQNKLMNKYRLEFTALSGVSQKLKHELCTILPWESVV